MWSNSAIKTPATIAFAHKHNRTLCTIHSSTNPIHRQLQATIIAAEIARTCTVVSIVRHVIKGYSSHFKFKAGLAPKLIRLLCAVWEFEHAPHHPNTTNRNNAAHTHSQPCLSVSVSFSFFAQRGVVVDALVGMIVWLWLPRI